MATSISRGEQIRRASVAQKFNPLTASADARAQAAREGKSIEQKFSEQVVSSGIGGSQQAQAERRVVQEQAKVIAASQAGSVQAQKSVETQLKRGDIKQQFIERRQQRVVAAQQLEPTFEPIEVAERPVTRTTTADGRPSFTLAGITLDPEKQKGVDVQLVVGRQEFEPGTKFVADGRIFTDTPPRKGPKLKLFEQPTLKALTTEGPEFRFETPSVLITQLPQGTVEPNFIQGKLVPTTERLAKEAKEFVPPFDKVIAGTEEGIGEFFAFGQRELGRAVLTPGSDFAPVLGGILTREQREESFAEIVKVSEDIKGFEGQFGLAFLAGGVAAPAIGSVLRILPAPVALGAKALSIGNLAFLAATDPVGTITNPRLLGFAGGALSTTQTAKNILNFDSLRITDVQFGTPSGFRDIVKVDQTIADLARGARLQAAVKTRPFTQRQSISEIDSIIKDLSGAAKSPPITISKQQFLVSQKVNQAVLSDSVSTSKLSKLGGGLVSTKQNVITEVAGKGTKLTSPKSSLFKFLDIGEKGSIGGGRQDIVQIFKDVTSSKFFSKFTKVPSATTKVVSGKLTLFDPKAAVAIGSKIQIIKPFTSGDILTGLGGIAIAENLRTSFEADVSVVTPAVAVVPAVATVQKSIQVQAPRFDLFQSNLPKELTSEVVSQKQDVVLFPLNLSDTVTGQQQVQKEVSLLVPGFPVPVTSSRPLTVGGDPFRGKPVRDKTDRIITDPDLIIFGFPKKKKGDGKKKKKKKKKGKKRKGFSIFTPSVKAITLGIFAKKQPKFVTGFGLRPIVVTKKKKGRRGRRQPREFDIIAPRRIN